MPRIILAIFLAVLAIVLAIALMYLLFKLCECLFRLAFRAVRFLAGCLRGLWQAAFPKPLPRPRPAPSPNLLHLLEISKRIARSAATEKANRALPAIAATELPPRTLPPAPKPGEHCLWVRDILVTVRDKDGKITFETTPASRWNEAITYLQDEGILDQIISRTHRWNDSRPPAE
jgi:hypothetical protein